MPTLNNATVQRAKSLGLKIVSRPVTGRDSRQVAIKSTHHGAQWVVSGKGKISRSDQITDVLKDLENLRSFLEVA